MCTNMGRGKGGYDMVRSTSLHRSFHTQKRSKQSYMDITNLQCYSKIQCGYIIDIIDGLVRKQINIFLILSFT